VPLRNYLLTYLLTGRHQLLVTSRSLIILLSDRGKPSDNPGFSGSYHSWTSVVSLGQSPSGLAIEISDIIRDVFTSDGKVVIFAPRVEK